MDTEAWAQLDEESAGQLRDRFDGARLGHLLTALLATAPIQEASLHAQLAAATMKDGNYEQLGDADSAASDTIANSLASGACDDSMYAWCSQAIAAAVNAGVDEAAAVCIADKHLCLARVREA
jgi:hypothetical protein